MAAYLDAPIASALKKAGKDENFRLKAEQRVIIRSRIFYCFNHKPIRADFLAQFPRALLTAQKRRALGSRLPLNEKKTKPKFQLERFPWKARVKTPSALMAQ